MMNVTIIQYLLLLALLIVRADSNVESSNIGQTRIGFGYLTLDTAETLNVPGRLSCSQQRAPTYTRTSLNDAKGVNQTEANLEENTPKCERALPPATQLP